MYRSALGIVVGRADRASWTPAEAVSAERRHVFSAIDPALSVAKPLSGWLRSSVHADVGDFHSDPSSFWHETLTCVGDRRAPGGAARDLACEDGPFCDL